MKPILTTQTQLYIIPRPTPGLDPEFRELRAIVGTKPFTKEDYARDYKSACNVTPQEAEESFHYCLSIGLIEPHSKEIFPIARPKTR